MDTRGIIPAAELQCPYPSKEESSPYQASNPFVFAAMIKALPIDRKDFTFVDVGSGKGRVLLMASELDFRRVIGVEFVRELHEAALDNVRRYAARRPGGAAVECVHADACEWVPPAENLVVFLFNPFGPGVLTRLLANIRESLASHPREVYLLYLHPVHEAVFRESGFLSRVGHSEKLDFVIYGGAARSGSGPGKGEVDCPE